MRSNPRYASQTISVPSRGSTSRPSGRPPVFAMASGRTVSGWSASADPAGQRHKVPSSPPATSRPSESTTTSSGADPAGSRNTTASSRRVSAGAHAPVNGGGSVASARVGEMTRGARGRAPCEGPRGGTDSGATIPALCVQKGSAGTLGPTAARAARLATERSAASPARRHGASTGRRSRTATRAAFRTAGEDGDRGRRARCA